MVTISQRFNGPTSSGNGGYVCGLLALEHAGAGADAVTATLRQPPPLETPLVWERHDDQTHLVTTGGALVGTAQDGTLEIDPPEPTTRADALRAERGYAGHADHPFPRCFTCGTDREKGDGLRLFTGPAGPDRTAAPWTPHPAFADADGLVELPVVWAALDCPGGWAADFTRQVMVLGRMTGQVVRRPRADEELTVTGLLRERDGRKMHTATALHDADGMLVGRAEQVWIEVPAGSFG